MSDLIRIEDLEVHCRIGVTDAERAQPQRLLLSLELSLDTAAAAASDNLDLTANYSDLARGLTRFGLDRQWRLIEALAADLAKWVLEEYRPTQVSVEVKKFVLPNARFVSVRIIRQRCSGI